jgi:HSP20 family molecular chaperone IbpA
MRRYNPWDEFMRMHDELDRIFENFIGPRKEKYLLGKGDEEGGELQTYSEPASDIIDKGDAFQVILDLPGVEKKDISLTVHKRHIEVKAERKKDYKEEKEGYYVHERGYVGYARNIPLPSEVMPEESKAEYNNGVLELTVKKAQPDKKESFKIDLG